MAIRSLIVVLIVAISGVYARDLGAKRSFTQGMPAFDQIPASIGQWQSRDFPLERRTAAVLAADAALQRRYFRSDGSEVWFFVAYFAEQEVNSQIHSPRHCVPGSGWKIISLDRETVSLPGARQNANRMFIERNGQRQEMLYWFRTRGGTVTGEYSLKWDLVKNSLTRKPTDAAFVRFSASVKNAEALREVMGHLEGPLNSVLAGVGL